jgi:hypothetical protein
VFLTKAHRFTAFPKPVKTIPVPFIGGFQRMLSACVKLSCSAFHLFPGNQGVKSSHHPLWPAIQRLFYA